MADENKRRIEITKDLTNYLSFRKRQPITDTIKDLIKKRGKKKPVAQDISVEQVRAVIEESPVKEDEETASVVIEKKPFLGRYFKWFKNLFSKNPETEELEAMEKEAEEVDIQQEPEELEKEETEEPPERRFFWNFFADLFKRKTDYESPEESEVDGETDVKKLILERPEVEKDMKQMAIITQEILKRLPQKELQDFKNSMEFAIYKDVLRRYKLIREGEK